MPIPLYVQSNSNGTASSDNLSVSLVFLGAQSAGNCNVVAFSVNNASPAGVTDTSGNTYNLIASQTAGGNWSSYVYIAFAIQSSAAGANTVTATFGSAPFNLPPFNILEYSNCAAIDTFSATTGSGTTVTASNITPGNVGELLFAYTMGLGATTMSAGSGYTFRSTSFWDGIEDALSVGTSPIASTFASSNSVNWVAITIAISAVSVPTSQPQGGHYSMPTVVRLQCLTTGATIYYTLDGTTPTLSSPVYVNPIVLPASGSIILKTLGTLPGTFSPINTYYFYIQEGGLWSTLDDPRDVNTGAHIFQFEGSIMYDPPSGYWYKYGTDFDVWGATNFVVYRSADLLNWELRASYGYYGFRNSVIYNALNNNYVLWASGSTANNGKGSFISSSPDGPFTLVNSYTTTWGGISIVVGDSSAFLDPNTGIGYFLVEGNNNTDFMIVQLSPDFLSLTNTYAITTSSGGEAPTMWSNGPNSYFLLQSAQVGFGTGGNAYQHATSPLGPWAPYPQINPFQPASIPQTPGEVVWSIFPSKDNAYDTQTSQVVSIPGRNGFLYCGDRYDGSFTPMPYYRRIILPVIHPTSTTATITWAPTWNLNTTFPTVSGAPAPARALVVYLGLAATWVNEEGKACNIYLDNSDDPSFARGVVSEVLPDGASNFRPQAYAQPGRYWRVRTVNANGESVSDAVMATLPPPLPPIGGAAVGRKNFSFRSTQEQGLPSPQDSGAKSPLGVQSLPSPL